MDPNQTQPTPIPPEIANLETQKVKPVQSSPIPPWIVMGSLFIFQPLGLFFIFRYKRYHSWVPHIIMVSGLISLGVYVTIAFSVVPAIESLSNNSSSNTFQAGLVNTILVILSALSIAQIVSWYFLRKQVKKNGELSPLAIGISVTLIIILQGFGPYYILNSILTPIYSIVGQIK